MRIEEKEYTKSIDFSIWKKVLPFLAPRKNVLLMVVVMNCLCSVVDIIMPLFQRQAIDSFIEKNTLAGLGGFIAVYIAVIVFQMWTVICFTRGCMTLDVETGRDMKRALFVHLQKLSFSYYNATPVGYILSRVMNDVARITELIAWDVIDMMWAIFYVVGVFVAMLFLNWKLALVIMLIVPAIAVLTWYFQNKILTWNRKVRKINSRITSGYNEGIMGEKQ
ncbi:MAG: ABC transporter transmembrane domain-containing protein [Blautia sp.]